MSSRPKGEIPRTQEFSPFGRNDTDIQRLCALPQRHRAHDVLAANNANSANVKLLKIQA